MRSILLLLLGVPIPVIILIALVSHCWYGRWELRRSDLQSGRRAPWERIRFRHHQWVVSL